MEGSLMSKIQEIITPMESHQIQKDQSLQEYLYFNIQLLKAMDVLVDELNEIKKEIRVLQ
jgi:hypothetical protein